MFLIHYGCDPEWVLDLDMLAFNALVETAMKLEAKQRYDTAIRDRMIAHDDGKGFKNYLKELSKDADISTTGNADDLVADLSRAGNI